MKINKKEKGIVDLSEKYNPTPTEEEMLEMYASMIGEDDEAADAAAEEMQEAEVLEREENARALARWEKLAQENLKLIRDVSGAIGDRLTYLFEKKQIEKASFARQIGVGRTTLHRYLKGTATPSEKKLLLIIDALEMDAGDFCYEPKDIEKWKMNLEEGAKRSSDIFELKNEFLEKLARNHFTYTYKGSTYRLPYKHYITLKTMLESSFKVLDLLSHDKYE